MFNKNKFLMEWTDNYQPSTGYEHEIIIPIDNNNQVKLIARYLAYKKKEDFLFAVCHNEKQTLEQCAGIYDNLRLDERADYDVELVEVSWRYESETLHQLQLAMQDRVYVIRKFLPFLRQFLSEGYGGPTPHENVMAVAYPHGFKILDNLGGVSAEQGQKQREMFARRVGIGAMKECGWCFAKYNAEGKLQPL